jgi:hypothetical protein
MTFNGTGFTHNYSSHSTDIVGYAWRTEEYCPRCTLEAMGTSTTGPVRAGAVLESEIEIWAAENGLSDMRETTEVPQPIFNSDDAFDNEGRPRTCCRCHEQLVESNEE